jgi:hypothetical protein
MDWESLAVANLEPVIAWGDWQGDVPREGVAIVGGAAHFFSRDEKATADMRRPEFLLWPLEADELADELALFRSFLAYRARFDAGKELSPFENDVALERRVIAHRTRFRPALARRAQVEFVLDDDRSVVERVPAHAARWRVLD